MKKLTLRSFLFFFTICLSANVVGQYQINGNATSLGPNCFQLNPDLQNQVGSVWNKDVLNLNHPFDFTFNINLGCANGGDGICFGLQPLSSGIGVGGNGMGMMGISPSVGVFIDTYENSWDTDPTYDHISLNANGNVDHTTSNNLAGPFQASSTNADIEDCSNHKLRVKWDASAKNYKVWFDDVLRISYTGNIITNIFGGNPNVYWGFTGATGLFHNDQRFCLTLAANFSATTVCSGVATAFTDLSNSADPITNWAWDFGDGSPVFSGTTAATYKNPSHAYAAAGTYTVQQTVTSSAGVSIISHNIIVKPSPVMTATPAAMEFCSGGTTAISLKSSLAATTITWNTSATGGSVTGYSGGSGASISQILNATGSTAGVVTYNVTGSLNGCTRTVSVPVKINPIPTIITTPSSQTFCSGGTTGIALTGSVSGTTYTWSVLSSTGVSGASAGNGTVITQTLTATGTNAGTVVYEITPKSASPANCQGIKKTVTITVNPRPVITPTITAQAICSGESTSIGLQSNINGTTFNWVAVATGGVTGSANGSGSNIVQTLTTTGTNSGTVEYTITATTPAPVSCSNTVTTKVIITVHPVPAISINTPPAICAGQSVKLTATVAPAGGMFLWTPGSSTSDNITISPTTSIAYNVKYTVNNCSNQASRNVTVNPKPNAMATSLSTICSGDSTSIQITGNVTGTTYTYTAATVNVFGAGGGAGNLIKQTLTLNNITDSVIYTIIPTSAEGCTGDPIKSKVIVNPRASISFSSSNQPICSGTAVSADVVSNVAGTMLTWTPRPTLAIGAKKGSGPSPVSIKDVLSVTGDTAVTVIYDLTGASVGGCLNLPLASLLKFIVNPLPKINTDSLKINASNCGTVTGSITGLSMVSGIAPFKYEWKNSQGVIIGTNLVLNPALLGVYTLKVSDANGCSTTIGADNKLNIQNIKSVTAAFTSDVTSGETPLNVQFNNQSTSTVKINYNWDFGNGSTSILKDPSAIFDMVKEYTVCLIVDDGVKGCSDTMCSLIETGTTADLLIVPNVFTPNGDGINDLLMITAKGLETMNAQIYNRWGEKLYEWNTLSGGWDGFTVSGIPAPEGTYFIILVASGADKKKTILPPVKQSFTLLR